MAHIVIPGGSGFLGRQLSKRLVDRGDRVTVLSRGRQGERGGVTTVAWDAETLGEWVSVLEGADAIVHLTGKRVDCRPTSRNRALLISSRVDPVLLVGRALAEVGRPPPVWVQSGTLAIFGDGGDQVITEHTVPSGVGPPQMVQVALAWEHAFARATAGVDRPVLLRVGVTIGGEDDPATSRLAQLARLGLGGTVGSGHQWMSWVGLDDVMAVFLRALDDSSMRGLYHVTAPSPVRNTDMMAAVRDAVGRSLGLPAPAWLTRLGAPILGSDPALALTGRRCIPERLLDQGFAFSATDLAQELAATIRS